MLFGKQFSLVLNKFSTLTTSLKWRNQFKQNQLVSQISSILLQRHNWIPILRKLNLSLKLSPNLFIRILRKTQNDPQTSLDFFNWAKTDLRFEPNLNSQCKIIQILVESHLLQPATPLLDAVIQSEPALVVLDSIFEACKGRDSQSLVLGFVLECYSNKDLVFKGLEIFRKIRVSGYHYHPSIRSCNALLDALQRAGEVRPALCFYAAVLRNGTSPDSCTWTLIAQLLCKEGKLENAVRLLNSGMCNVDTFSLIIGCYSKNGNFMAALGLLNDMKCKNFTPEFGTYCSILDGACKFGDVEVIEMVMKDMTVMQLLPEIPFSNCDQIIQNLCILGKSYAAEMFFERAQNKGIQLEETTYGCMLRALSKEGRGKEARTVYGMIVERRITVNHSSYNALADVICQEEPTKEVNKLLKDLIGRGIVPSASVLSRFVGAQCNKSMWKEAEDLLNVILKKGFLPDSFCCCSLVDHYCSDGQINSAVALHDKLEKLGRTLDVTTYNVLLNGLFVEKMIEEAIRVFDYMRRRNVVNSASFSIMISGLIHEKELRKAMKIHDEMLKVRLKPDESTYKRLIAGFM